MILEEMCSIVDAHQRAEQALVQEGLDRFLEAHGHDDLDALAESLRLEFTHIIDDTHVFTEKQKQPIFENFENETLATFIQLLTHAKDNDKPRETLSIHQRVILSAERRFLEEKNHLQREINQFLKSTVNDFSRLANKMVDIHHELFHQRQGMGVGQVFNQSNHQVLKVMLQASSMGIFIFCLELLLWPYLLNIPPQLFFSNLAYPLFAFAGFLFLMTGPLYASIIYLLEYKRCHQSQKIFLDKERIQNKLLRGFEQTEQQFNHQYREILIKLFRLQTINLTEITADIDLANFYEKTNLDLEEYYQSEVESVVDGIIYMIDAHIELTFERIRVGKYGPEIAKRVGVAPDKEMRDFCYIHAVLNIKKDFLEQVMSKFTMTITDTLFFALNEDRLGACYDLVKIRQELDKAYRFIINLQALVISEIVRFDSSETIVEHLLMRIYQNPPPQLHVILDKVEERLSLHTRVENGKFTRQSPPKQQHLREMFQAYRSKLGQIQH